MHRNPTLPLVLAVAAVSIQAAIASPDHQTRSLEARCHDSPELAAQAAGVGRIYIDVEGDDVDCLAGRLQIALEVALERVDPVARERRLLCSPACWLDRPTSAIARVGHRERIWPAPPRPFPDGWVVFVVMVPDLTESWWWIAVGPPDADRQVAIEVIDG